MREIKKVTKQILKNLAKGVKIAVFGPHSGDSMGSSSSWLIDDNLRKLYAQNKTKVTEQILRNFAKME